MNVMRKRALIFGAIAAAGLCAAPAWAGSYQCDNDRSAGQYPNCSNMGGHNYVYRSGQAGDWNGDDRLNSTNSGWYGYFFPGTDRYYSFYAWLNNAAFTDAYARYNVINTANGSQQTAAINQNTAPGGWNYVGYGYGYLFTVTPSGNGRNGADIVQLYFNGLAAADAAPRVTEADRDLSGRCAAVAPQDARVAALQQRMLDAVDRYRDAAGSVDVRFGNNGQDEAIDFEVSQSARTSFVRIARDRGRVEEHVSRAGTTLSLYPQTASYSETRTLDAPAPSGARQYRNARCEPVFVHRPDPAGAVGADAVLSPQNYAFWLSTEDVRIAGHQRLLGRDATVVAGKHGDYLGRKLGAERFRMWVDSDTGVLLKLVGSDRQGKAAYSIVVRDLRLDSGLKLTPSLAAPQGWTRVGED
ncbi:hypothetical protein [Lysobacter sp. Root983]|uniref:hypothetical protein n=1 Tax=Lysobacter sp. Root983 TaxID=1736613 RepID=UPI000AFDB28D|nr:hypothetical protein [Lysobacter sp. Root983]